MAKPVRSWLDGVVEENRQPQAAPYMSIVHLLLRALPDRALVLDPVVVPFTLSEPSHIPFHTAKGYTLSMAKQVLSGRMDSVIKTIERNVRLT